MKLGIRGHDLGTKDVQSLSNALQEYGFSGVQLVAYKSIEGIEYKPNSVTAMQASQISSTLAQKGLQIFLLGAYFNPVHSNAQKVQDCVHIFKDYLQLAQQFDSPLVASETGSFNDDKWTYNPKNRTKEALDMVVRTFAPLCDFAKQHKTCVAIEGAAGHVCYDVPTLARAVEQINADNLKVVFDLYNFLDAQNHEDSLQILQQGLRAFEGKIHCFHLKNYNVVDGRLVQCGLCEGILDYKSIVRIIKDYDPDAKLVFEGVTGKDIKTSLDMISCLI